MKKLVIGLLTVFVLAACGSKSPTSIKGQWKLVSHGSGSSQIPAVADVETSIDFGDGPMSGNVGCNGFGGEYVIDGDKITFSPIESTLMFCEGPVGGQELAVLSVLQESATFVMEGNILTITSADGSSSIMLEMK